MLNKEDVRVLRGVFGEMLEENNHILKREIRDEIHAVVNGAVFASEERMMSAIKNIQKNILTLRDDILDLVNDEILPQIDECQRDIVQLKAATNIA